MEKDSKNCTHLIGDGGIYGDDALGILLYNAFGQESLPATAALRERFPGASAALGADYAELIGIDGVTRDIAAYIKAVDALLRQLKSPCYRITCLKQLKELVRNRLGQAENEIMEFYFTDGEGNVKGIKTFYSGKINRVEASLKEVLPTMLLEGVENVYFAHNHVGAVAKPSEDDDVTTGKIIYACGALGLKLADHIIIGDRESFYSYRLNDKLKAQSSK